MPFAPTASRRIWTLALAAGIALTGCSDSGSSDAVSSVTTGAGTDTASTLAPAATLAEASQIVSSTSAIADGSATRSDGSSTALSGNYCDSALAAQAATNAFNALGADPRSTADPAAVFDAYVATIIGLAASAPAELVADLQRNADAMAKLKPILAEAGYDVAKAFEDPAINTILTAEVNAGSQRINDYNASACGLSGVSTTTSLAAP